MVSKTVPCLRIFILSNGETAPFANVPEIPPAINLQTSSPIIELELDPLLEVDFGNELFGDGCDVTETETDPLFNPIDTSLIYITI